MARSAAIRSWIGGCVEKRRDAAEESSGDSIYRCATAFERAFTTVLSRANTSSADRKPAGFLVKATAVASASDSRRRETAAFNSVAAIGARIKGIIAKDWHLIITIVSSAPTAEPEHSHQDI